MASKFEILKFKKVPLDSLEIRAVPKAIPFG